MTENKGTPQTEIRNNLKETEYICKRKTETENLNTTNEVTINDETVTLNSESLDRVRNNMWIDDDVISSVIYKDLIFGHESTRLLVDPLNWNPGYMPDHRTQERVRQGTRLITQPHFAPNFEIAIIPINIDKVHWTLGILTKGTKYVGTMTLLEMICLSI